MRFVGIAKEDLEGLHKAMEIFGEVYDHDDFHPVLYVLINQGAVLDLAGEAIHEAGDYDNDEGQAQESPKPSMIAVAVPMSSDQLYYIVGSGLYIGDAQEEFAYSSGEEGARTCNFSYAGGREKLSLNQIVALAVSDDDTYLDEFLLSHGPSEPVENTENKPVERTEEVTAPAKAEFKADPGEPAVPTPGVQSKLKAAGSSKGIDKVLIAGKPVKDLKVTEIIEVSDFVMDHPNGAYLHAETASGEWLFFSTDPNEGKAAAGRMLMFREDLDAPPPVNVLSGKDVEALLETLADDELEA
jgi:hypothetical protein